MPEPAIPLRQASPEIERPTVQLGDTPPRVYTALERLEFAIKDLDEKSYHPEILGKGGENIVLTFPKRVYHEVSASQENLIVDVPERKLPREMRDAIVKVNFRKSTPLLREMVGGDTERQKREEGKLDAEIRRRRSEIAELRGYFGFRAVPGMIWKQNAPVSADLLKALRMHQLAERRLPAEVPAIYTLQRRFDLPDSSEGVDHVEVSAYYPEERFADEDEDTQEARVEYDHAHDVLIGKELPKDREDAIACIKNAYPHLGYAVRLAEEERHAHAESAKPFTAALQQFAKKLIQYTKDTDLVLDLSGRQNVVFLKEGDAWSVRLLDVVQSDAFITMGDLRASAKMIRNRTQKTGREYANDVESGEALNPLNTLRIMNALAILADIPDRYEIPALKEIRPETWRKSLKEIFK